MRHGRAKKIAACLFTALALGVLPNTAPAPTDFRTAFAAETNWVWISSDEKYGKFFAPSNIQTKTSIHGVATCISAWIKTSYTFGGAEETIENYGIKGSIPDPRALSYSLALVEVFPQTRKIHYIQENFYNAEGKVIWSRVNDPPKEYEINSQAFDEDYYVAIVDSVFHHGEKARKDDPNRWISLWTATTPGGISSVAIADTTTMRLAGENLIYWEWMETKNSTGSVIEAKFMKKALNHDRGAQKIIRCKYWNPADGWKDMDSELDGRYTEIPKGSAEYPGLQRLRAFVKGYQYWLNRYRTDLPQTPNGAKKNTNKNETKKNDSKIEVKTAN